MQVASDRAPGFLAPARASATHCEPSPGGERASTSRERTRCTPRSGTCARATPVRQERAGTGAGACRRCRGSPRREPAMQREAAQDGASARAPAIAATAATCRRCTPSRCERKACARCHVACARDKHAAADAQSHRPGYARGAAGVDGGSCCTDPGAVSLWRCRRRALAVPPCAPAAAALALRRAYSAVRCPPRLVVPAAETVSPLSWVDGNRGRKKCPGNRLPGSQLLVNLQRSFFEVTSPTAGRVVTNGC